jgi:hypothetical protein
MRFQFRVGDPTHRELVSTPGLRVTVVVDGATSHIIGVAFRGRRT